MSTKTAESESTAEWWEEPFPDSEPIESVRELSEGDTVTTANLRYDEDGAEWVATYDRNPMVVSEHPIYGGCLVFRDEDNPPKAHVALDCSSIDEHEGIKTTIHPNFEPRHVLVRRVTRSE